MSSKIVRLHNIVTISAASGNTHCSGEAGTFKWMIALISDLRYFLHDTPEAIQTVSISANNLSCRNTLYVTQPIQSWLTTGLH